SLKFAIAVGIGLLIAFVGLEWAGIVVDSPSTYVKLGNLKSPVTLLSLFGVAVIGILMALHFRGAILVGMLATAAAGFFATRMWGGHWGYDLTGAVSFGTFPDITATAGKVFGGFGPLFGHKVGQIFLVIFTFLLLDVFDTVGTLVGLGERAGLMKDGQLPNAREAMMADALGTLSGTVMGTSTITSYIESSAGIAAGARTGLAALVTAGLFLIAIFAYPFLNCIGAEVPVPAAALGAFSGAQTILCYPVIAPVLIIIGCYMLPIVGRIKWDDFSEALPAFLTIVIMQFSMSITDGIAWGFISYTILKIFTAKPQKCPIIVYICSVLFVLYYAFGR
ncbi:MAG: NCS2 family permease, partial [Calditrichaceae bacterium]|nr:NCS2 family permease [Calditrichaceae bacterium]